MTIYDLSIGVQASADRLHPMWVGTADTLAEAEEWCRTAPLSAKLLASLKKDRYLLATYDSEFVTDSGGTVSRVACFGKVMSKPRGRATPKVALCTSGGVFVDGVRMTGETFGIDGGKSAGILDGRSIIRMCSYVPFHVLVLALSDCVSDTLSTVELDNTDLMLSVEIARAWIVNECSITKVIETHSLMHSVSDRYSAIIRRANEDGGDFTVREYTQNLASSAARDLLAVIEKLGDIKAACSVVDGCAMVADAETVDDSTGRRIMAVVSMPEIVIGYSINDNKFGRRV